MATFHSQNSFKVIFLKCELVLLFSLSGFIDYPIYETESEIIFFIDRIIKAKETRIK